MFPTLIDTGALHLVTYLFSNRPAQRWKRMREPALDRVDRTSKAWRHSHEVRHLVVQRLVDLSGLLGNLSTGSRNFC